MRCARGLMALVFITGFAKSDPVLAGGLEDAEFHVHVERNSSTAKFWLDSVRVVHGGSFGRRELRRIERIVEENRYALLEQWDEHF